MTPFVYFQPSTIFSYIWSYGLIHSLLYIFAFLLDLFFFGKPKIYKETLHSLKHDFFANFLELINAREGLANLMLFGGVIFISDKLPSLELNKFFNSNPFLGLLFFLIVYDFLLYWYHRLSHRDPFWIQHEYHHAPTFLNPISDIRIHALSYPFLFVIVLIPTRFLYIIPKEQILIFFCSLDVLSICAHSRWNTSYGWFGKYILVSPRYHRLHHSKTPKKHSNFGTYLAFWDHIFKTYQDPTHAFELETGVESEHFTNSQKSILTSYLNVYPRFLKKTFKLIIK